MIIEYFTLFKISVGDAYLKKIQIKMYGALINNKIALLFFGTVSTI